MTPPSSLGIIYLSSYIASILYRRLIHDLDTTPSLGTARSMDANFNLYPNFKFPFM